MADDDVIMVEPDDEDVVYCSSTYYKHAIKYKPKELHEKMLLARRITQACKQITSNNDSDKEFKMHSTYKKVIVEKIQTYTDLPRKQIENILSSASTRDRSLTTAFKNVAEINDQTLDYLSNDIRSIFVHYYVVTKRLPSKLMLLKQIKDKAGMYLEEDLSIQKLVKNKLVKYYHIPAFNRYLLMEHPERTYKRTLYLRAIQEYRLQGRNIIYIDMRKLVTLSNPTFYVGLALLPHQKLLEKFLAKDLSDMGPIKWLNRRVIPNIPPNSVVVMYQVDRKTKKLTSNSRRSEIIAWLNENNISYGKNPHTAEAYALYKAHEKGVEAKGPFDHIFAQAGIDVINCSKQWTYLNCFKRFWEQVTAKYDILGRKLDLEMFKDIIIKASNWINQNMDEAEQKLIEEEKKMILEDNEMEIVLENLMEMIEAGDINDADFPDDICGDKTENFETHICNIVSLNE